LLSRTCPVEPRPVSAFILAPLVCGAFCSPRIPKQPGGVIDELGAIPRHKLRQADTPDSNAVSTTLPNHRYATAIRARCDPRQREPERPNCFARNLVPPRSQGGEHHELRSLLGIEQTPYRYCASSENQLRRAIPQHRDHSVHKAHGAKDNSDQDGEALRLAKGHDRLASRFPDPVQHPGHSHRLKTRDMKSPMAVTSPGLTT